MSALSALVVSFKHSSTQKLNDNYEQSIVLPVMSNTSQSNILPFFDNDHQLLPGQSRITHIYFEQSNSPPLASCNNKQGFQINFKIHDGFTPSEEMLIKNALEIISARLFKAEILENMYHICGTSGEFLGPRVWSRSQLGNNQNYNGMYDLLRFQLMCLKIKGENGQFPIIRIYPFYAKTDTQAQGAVGCISCISHGSTFSIEGNFDVKLNRYNLNTSNENVDNVVFWAGAIVHEMLHNLGHKHKTNDYTDQWQINLFENCFTHNGNYKLL